MVHPEYVWDPMSGTGSSGRWIKLGPSGFIVGKH